MEDKAAKEDRQLTQRYKTVNNWEDAKIVWSRGSHWTAMVWVAG